MKNFDMILSMAKRTNYQELLFEASIEIDGKSYLISNEPAIEFVKAYHAALINSIVFDIPSSCPFFSSDIFIDISKANDGLESLKVELRVSNAIVACVTVSKEVMLNIFRDLILKIIGILDNNYEYSEISEILSSSMIPVNEFYLETFLGSRGGLQ